MYKIVLSLFGPTNLLTKSSSFNAKEAKTSNEEDVTPPLFAEASLKKTQPCLSKEILHVCAMNKLAPSTTSVSYTHLDVYKRQG